MYTEEFCDHTILNPIESSYVTLSFRIARPAWVKLQEAEVFKEFKGIVETLEEEYLNLKQAIERRN